MRGKVTKRTIRPERTGITPAYAGKRGLVMFSTEMNKDHPRVCGEKTATDYYLPTGTGSPPRMRGKEPLAALALKSEGITPAYAGKRGFLIAESFLIRDHPRVCGEKFS